MRPRKCDTTGRAMCWRQSAALEHGFAWSDDGNPRSPAPRRRIAVAQAARRLRRTARSYPARGRQPRDRKPAACLACRLKCPGSARVLLLAVPDLTSFDAINLNIDISLRRRFSDVVMLRRTLPSSETSVAKSRDEY